MSIKLNLNQARQLLDFFGGEDAQVTVSDSALNLHSGPGLYAWLTEHPEEGSIKLDEEDRPNDPHDDLTPGADPTDRAGIPTPAALDAGNTGTDGGEDDAAVRAWMGGASVEEAKALLTTCPHGTPHRWSCEQCDTPGMPGRDGGNKGTDGGESCGGADA